MPTRTKHRLVQASVVAGVTSLVMLGLFMGGRAEAERTVRFERPIRPHFDHAAVIQGPFATPQDVTRACLGCHPSATSVMQTAHFTWLGDEVQVPGHPGKVRIGKKNLINNFCIATIGNEKACTKCHAGYGWADAKYDFSRSENVDCLVCHEHGSGYVKGAAGLPESGVDLIAAARSVGTPGRENCLSCHAYGGG